MGRILCFGLDELEVVAHEILRTTSDCKVYLMRGQMGAGKTTLVKSLCSALGAIDPVSSPTFALVNEYLSPEHGVMYHFDLYRLESSDELFKIGFEEYIDSNRYCFIEWPELAMELLPPPYVGLQISVDETSQLRTIAWHIVE